MRRVILICFELSSKRVATELRASLIVLRFRFLQKSLQKTYTLWQKLNGLFLGVSKVVIRAKPLFSDVGMHYIANGNCTWFSFIQSCLLFFPQLSPIQSARGFVGVDLPTGIRRQGQAASGWQQCIGSSDKEVGSGCREFI
jgi:hypothetical protein